MVSNPHKLLVIFGLKREYDTFSPIKILKEPMVLRKNFLTSLKEINLSEIDTVINIGYCGAIDSSAKSGDIIKINNIMDENGKKLNVLVIQIVLKKIENLISKSLI